MTETIRSLVELVDVTPTKGSDCLEARTAAIGAFVGLGPPDLCRLVKSVKPLSALESPTIAKSRRENGAVPTISRSTSETACTKSDELTFFHYVIGLVVADAHSASTYITSLMAAQEACPRRKPLFKGRTWCIRGGTYCCFNAFARVDVRVAVRIPGMPGMVSFGIDADGREVPLTREIWEGTQLSSLLRTLREPPRVTALRALPVFSKAKVVDSFVHLATRHFTWGERLEDSPECRAGTHPLCELFCGFLVGSRRLKLALEVLPSLQSLLPAVAIHIAGAYLKRRQPEAALNSLVRAARQVPEEAPVLHCQAKVLLKERHSGAIDLAVAAAELAVRLRPSAWKFWVTLAKAYLQAGRLGECLATLNAPAFTTAAADAQQPDLGVPDVMKAEHIVPQGPHSGALMLRPVVYELFPAHKSVAHFRGFGSGFGLHPGLDDTIGYQPPAAAASGLPAAAAVAGGGSKTASASITAGYPVGEGEADILLALDSCQGGDLSSVETGAYSALVAVYRHIGWEELLEQRSKIFVMFDGDSGNGEETDDSAKWDQASGAESFAEGAAGARKLPRRVCSKFLDRLFDVLHADLTVFSDWCREQEGPPRPGGISGSGALWMLRAALAERLQQDMQAELALRLCQARCVCPRASLQLLRVYLRTERVVEGVAQLAVLCGIASPTAGRNDPKPWAATGGWPDWLSDAAARVICRFGLSAVHAAAGRLPDACVDYRFALAELLRAAEDAGVDGCDR